MAAIILKTVILVMGIIMFVITVSSLAKRRMNESFCLAWGIISVAIIVAGCMLHPSQIGEYISNLGLILILIIFFSVVYAAYFVRSRNLRLTYPCLMKKTEECLSA